MLLKYLQLLLISMLPLIELRGAMPFSQIMDLPVLPSYIVCIVGNLIPIPFVYLFAGKFLKWGKDKKYIGKFCKWCLEKGNKAGAKIAEKAGRTSMFFALMLFVGIPLPGTGAWTGILAASFLDMGFKSATTAVTLGVILAGTIMMVASYLGFGLI
ncbi:MAG: small multi-drug export protein [Candidatus Saccharibacteria bacterium]|nr:small multi-drug export protein [Candidatus Saccharibacteria bacterium]